MAIVIPYVKQTWTDGSGGGTPISAARLAVLEEGILDVSQAPAVRVFHNTTQSITSGVATALAFNSERFDQAGGSSSTQHDTVTNNSRLTAVYAGVYAIGANVQWASSPTTAAIQLRVNGTTIIAQSQVQTDYRYMNVNTLYSFAVNDYVEVLVTQTSGGALNVSSTGNTSPEFWMVRAA